MATRGSRLADDHVRALNSIDLVFFGGRVFGRAWRSKQAQVVIDSWHEYHRHLNPPEPERPKTQDETTKWLAKGEELFLNLLGAIAVATGHEFTRDVLRTGGYSPQAHASRELEQEALRRMLIEVLTGARSVPLDVKSVPVNQGFVEADTRFKRDLVAAIERLGDDKGAAPDAAGPQP